MPKTRQTSIDYIKAFLVIGMVLAHALQLLSTPKGLFWLVSSTAYLITFSGFLFCFGYVFYLSYLSKPFQVAAPKMAKTALKTLFGYYLSGFFAFLLLSPRFLGEAYELSFRNIFALIVFERVAWISEFLLGFTAITVLVLVLFRPFQRLVESPVAMLLVSGLCFATAVALPTDFMVANLPGLLIGTRSFYAFPVVQYLPIFLAGLYMAKNRIEWNSVVFGVSLVGTAAFIGYYVLYHTLPPEFLPSVFWLTGSYGIIYAYFLLAKWLEREAVVIPFLLSTGRNTLPFLILSNLLLFALTSTLPPQSPAVAGVIGIGVLIIINFLIGLVQPPPADTPGATSVSSTHSAKKPV